jgi:hypothetical protein
MSSADTGNTFDYGASADLFSMANRSGRRQPLSYKHFDSAAEAIRYAIEDMPAQALFFTLLEVDESRCDGKDIRRLYSSPSFPLARRVDDPA